MAKKTKSKKTIQDYREKYGYPLTRRTEITDEILRHYSFELLPPKEDGLDREVWRMKMPFYHNEFHFVKGNYPATNPNCGILSVHTPAHEAVGFDNKGKRKTFKFEASTKGIAWYVNTAERLRSIILILSETNV
jgi:hypothetical protein